MSDAAPVQVGEQHGFIHADCEKCHNPDVWLTCNTCKKSDRFEVKGTTVVCACGAVYAHATCTCGNTVQFERLKWVAFDKGPAALADWEIDKGRVALLVIVAVAVVGGLVGLGLYLT